MLRPLAVALCAAALIGSAVPAVAATTDATHVATCTAAMLADHHRGDGAAGGHRAWILTATNVSKVSCRISGYPAVTLVSPSGQSLTKAAWTRFGYIGGLAPNDHGPLPVVVLRHGQSASVLLEGEDSPRDGGPACPTEAGLVVRMPGTHAAVPMHFRLGLCWDVEVHPVVSGRSGDAG